MYKSNTLFTSILGIREISYFGGERDTRLHFEFTSRVDTKRRVLFNIEKH